jgi:hypothetical protein
VTTYYMEFGVYNAIEVDTKNTGHAQVRLVEVSDSGVTTNHEWFEVNTTTATFSTVINPWDTTLDGVMGIATETYPDGVFARTQMTVAQFDRASDYLYDISTMDGAVNGAVQVNYNIFGQNGVSCFSFVDELYRYTFQTDRNFLTDFTPAQLDQVRNGLTIWKAPDGAWRGAQFATQKAVEKAIELFNYLDEIFGGSTAPMGPRCFDACVSVATENDSSMQIDGVVVGDRVLAFSSENTLHPARVTRLLHGVTTEWFVLDDGTRVTPGHQYLRPDGAFMAISDILARDGLVVDAAGYPKRVTGSLLRAIDAGSDATWIEPEPFAAGNTLLKPAPVFGWRTYNLTVEGLHTYIAGGCRVHNDCVQDGDQITDVDFDPVTNELVWTGTDVNGGAITITETRNPITGAVQIVERELSFGSNDAVVSSVWSTFDANHTPVGDPVQTVTFPGQVFTGNAIGGIFGSAIGQAIGGGNVFASVGAQAALSTVLGTVGHSLHIYFNDTHLSNVAGTAAATLEESVAVALNGVGAALGNNLLAAGSGANDNARLDAATGERTVA